MCRKQEDLYLDRSWSSPSSSLSAEEESCWSLCCPSQSFWKRRLQVMSGVRSGWGFTSKPREKLRYYLHELFAAVIIA
ncbi:inorganic anion sulfate permease family protein, partial [Cystoisospora suis]